MLRIGYVIVTRDNVQRLVEVPHHVDEEPQGLFLSESLELSALQHGNPFSVSAFLFSAFPAVVASAAIGFPSEGDVPAFAQGFGSAGRHRLRLLLKRLRARRVAAPLGSRLDFALARTGGRLLPRVRPPLVRVTVLSLTATITPRPAPCHCLQCYC